MAYDQNAADLLRECNELRRRLAGVRSIKDLLATYWLRRGHHREGLEFAILHLGKALDDALPLTGAELAEKHGFREHGAEPPPPDERAYPGPKLTPEQQERLAAARAKWDEKLAPQREALAEANRITAEDLAITITSPEPEDERAGALPKCQRCGALLLDLGELTEKYCPTCYTSAPKEPTAAVAEQGEHRVTETVSRCRACGKLSETGFRVGAGAEQGEADGWTLVDEQKPPRLRPVLVVHLGKVQWVAYRWCADHWEPTADGCDDAPADAFTHWRPLPDAPGAGR